MTRNSELPPESEPFGSLSLRGIAASPGVAIGPVVVVGRRGPSFKRRHVPDHAVGVEVERYQRAIRLAETHLRSVMERATKAGGELAILDAYVLMLADPILTEETERRIRLDRKAAEWAVWSAVKELSSQFDDAEDLYLRERSHDFHFVGELIIRALHGDQPSAPPVHISRPSIVVAHDLSPADTAAMDREAVLGIVTEAGTRTSHTAIMARALQIPAVVGVSDLMARVSHGDELVVDGLRGEVVVRPTLEDIDAARGREQRHKAVFEQLPAARGEPAYTACGTPICLRANIELPAEATLAADRGALGIGLYRTEFMYIDRPEPPSEDEQYALFRKVIQAVAPHPVTLRTFDIGGDKFSSSFAVPPEINPALGLRAVRLGLSHPGLLLDQLRAMVRASAHGPVRIMVPMVATLRELRQVRALLQTAIAQVDARGITRAQDIPLGLMMEVPSAALLARRFAQEAAFMSIGTNDLVQYTLAADRASRALAYLASPFDPSILMLIKIVVDAGNEHRCPVSLCGEAASDPLCALLLTGLGLRELSMEAAAIAEIKEALHRVTLDEAQAVAERALELDTAAAVEQAIAAAFAPRLADLLGG